MYPVKLGLENCPMLFFKSKNFKYIFKQFAWMWWDQFVFIMCGIVLGYYNILFCQYVRNSDKLPFGDVANY